jgi:hypothetical protein
MKSQALLEAMDDDDDDIECSNDIKRYGDRPTTMENVTLAEFISSYRRVTDSRPPSCKVGTNQHIHDLLPEPFAPVNEDEVEEEPEKDEESEPSATAQYKRRKRPHILRSVHFNPETDIENYYRELIMLYYPWRNESNLKHTHSCYADRYKELEADIEECRKKYEPFAEAVSLAEKRLQDNPNEEDAWDLLAPVTEHADAQDCARKRKPVDTGIENYDMAQDLGLPISNTEVDLHPYHEMNDADYRSHMQQLNPKQLQFVYDTIHHIKTSSEPLYRFLSGGAGVGKSFTTRALYQTALKFLNKKEGENFTSRKVLLLAPTGKAAYHIRGTTIHSGLKIQPKKKLQHHPLSAGALNTLRNEIGNVKLIFIDEVSMVGFRMFNCIHQRLMEVMQNPKPFGGVSIITVGDLFQLKPVMDSYVFVQPNSGYLPLADNLWTDLFSMEELTDIMRQADNKPFAELLNRMREGNQTVQDISTLKEHIVQEDSENYPMEATHLYATNYAVDAFNKRVILKSSNPKTDITAKDRVVGSTPPSMKDKILHNFRNSTETRQLWNVLEVSEGVCYDMTVNLDTDDGLINGASCTLMKIDIPFANTFDSAILWVQFQDPQIGRNLQSLNKRLYKHDIQCDWTPIEPVSRQYQSGTKGQAVVQRIQFPLRPAHAKSIHRSQGDTLQKAVIDLTLKMKVDHIHYVAISRLVSLDGLYLLNLQEDKISISQHVKKEMERLRSAPNCMTHLPLTTIPSECKVLFLNARSVNRHLQDIRQDANIQGSTIACFCESRLCRRDSCQDTAIGHFYQYRQDHSQTNTQSRPSYGMTVHSLSSFPKEPMNETSHNIEVTVFTVTDHEDKVFVSLYKSPSVSMKLLCEKLKYIHDKYLKNTTSVILGDFNVDWASESSDKMALEKLMVTELGYHQVIVGPTTDYLSTLDLIFTNMDTTDVISGTCETYYPDHKIVWIGW